MIPWRGVYQKDKTSLIYHRFNDPKNLPLARDKGRPQKYSVGPYVREWGHIQINQIAEKRNFIQWWRAYPIIPFEEHI